VLKIRPPLVLSMSEADVIIETLDASLGRAHSPAYA
jgi:4-aminobutyrate aminotransferase-like enzyme